MQGHTGPVLSLFYDLRGERLISGGADLSLRVWDAAFNGELRRFEAASNDLIGAYFPTDTLGLSVGHLGVLQWWRVDRLPDLVDWAAANRYLRPLSENECMVYRAQELCAAGGG
jgi:WD40 repeat protein